MLKMHATEMEHIEYASLIPQLAAHPATCTSPSGFCKVDEYMHVYAHDTKVAFSCGCIVLCGFASRPHCLAIAFHPERCSDADWRVESRMHNSE